MKLLTPFMLAMAVAAFALTACGEKQSGTATAPETAGKPMEQAVAPSSPPKATETAEAASDVHPGKAIHDANCISCHDAGVYTRADHKMKDYGMLVAQVRRCDANLGSKLFDDDINKVTEYLNDTYYKFPKS